ncbi:MAG: hypothetical protein SCABRO_00156 [Candidatus Scalindua brodae]|uniref:Uncharacterized protein n=1 Tax=Candidatus Scalindua brodae TaxID=237368 RepID=A0A0B0ESG0_9BACT|nr:MAG: hypothetical protein SCABRO_00156 [Candidatus Scalindua brodae]
MPYKTRPYISYTFGCLRNPFIQYEITKDKKLYTHRSFFGLFHWGPSAFLDLDKVSPEPTNQKFLNPKGWISMGDVKVSVPGKTEIFKNIKPMDDFILAVEGEHPFFKDERRQVQEEEEQKVKEAEIKASMKDENLADIIIYYPHIPKTVVTLLKALYPSKYDSARFTPLVKKGAWVEKGQTVGSYGEIKITATYSGRIEMLGNSQAGRFEWPETEGTVIKKFLDHDNDGSAKEEYHYSFALRPLLTDPDYIRTSTPDNNYYVARAFDNADVYKNNKKNSGLYLWTTYILYTLG